jgi:hypothetical protein
MDKEIYEAVFTFNSGGGSLGEGMQLGQFIADLPFPTLGQVGDGDQADGVCASACVLSYLGADYRYLHGNSQIGVHRFGAPESELDGSTALAVSQEISGAIVAYIRQMRADPELYELMSSTDFSDISWVPLEDLRRLRVVTDDIFSETIEYKNINGGLALYIEQVARNGDSTLFLMCGDSGLVGIANINKPEENPSISGFNVSVDGLPYELSDWEIVENGQWRLRVVFTIPPHAVTALIHSGKIGVQALQPFGTFFGFTGEPEDERISEMAKNCVSASPKQNGGLELHFDTDINGGDLSPEGYRPTTLNQCEEICRSNSQCVAISYIPEKQWCWPKSQVASSSTRKGVVSAWVQ